MHFRSSAPISYFLKSLQRTSNPHSLGVATKTMASQADVAHKLAPNGLEYESVWDYPRPPLIQSVPQRLRVIFNGVEIADTTSGWRICETSHPPTYYIPPKDIKMEYLKANSRQTYCEWKGDCSYWDVRFYERWALIPSADLPNQTD